MERLDGATIRQYLRASRLPDDLREDAVDGAIREMAEAAYRRLIIDECGALPGPPVDPPSITRKFIRFLEKLSGQSEHLPYDF